MKKITNLYLLFLLVVFSAMQGYAQQPNTFIEKVIVETYYVANATDAFFDNEQVLDSLPEGSKTYRVYIDLKPGYKLVNLFGTPQNPFKIKSTSFFFNNYERGKTSGNQINKRYFNRNNSALDTWVTLGMASSSHMGVLKSQDTDGTLREIDTNILHMLRNNTPEMGIPLTTADGLVEVEAAERPSITMNMYDNYNVFGDNSGERLRTEMNYTGDELVRVPDSNGVEGSTADNQILVLQLTTQGELSFELNLTVKTPEGVLYRFYANNPPHVPTENIHFFSNWLTYPFLSGCTNSEYLEYNPNAAIDNGSCATPIVLGCTDVTACNYDSRANFNVHELCCYYNHPIYGNECGGRNREVVCKTEGWRTAVYGCDDPTGCNYNPNATVTSRDLCCYRDHVTYGDSCLNPGLILNRACGVGIEDLYDQGYVLDVYPNPTQSVLNLRMVSPVSDAHVKYLIYNTMGQLVKQGSLTCTIGETIEPISFDELTNGIYQLQVVFEKAIVTKLVVKN